MLISDFSAMYPHSIDFINSTAAARINGYVSGYGTLQEIEGNLKNLGLSDDGNKLLLEIATRGSIHGSRTLNPPEL